MQLRKMMLVSLLYKSFHKNKLCNLSTNCLEVTQYFCRKDFGIILSPIKMLSPFGENRIYTHRQYR